MNKLKRPSEGDLVVVWVQSDQGRDVYEVALVAVLVQSAWDLIAFVAWVVWIRPMERAQFCSKAVQKPARYDQ